MKMRGFILILSLFSSILVFPGFEIKSFASNLDIPTISRPIQSFDLAQYSIQKRPRRERFLIINLIQKEIYHSLKRLNPLLTTYILIAVLVPTTSVLIMLILFFKVTQDSQRFCQNLEVIKEDFMLEFYAKISDAQEIVYEIQDSLQVTEERIKTIQYELDSISTQDDDLQDYTVEDEKHRLRNRQISVTSHQSSVTS